MARPLQEGNSPAAPVESTRGEGTNCLPSDIVSGSPCALPFISYRHNTSDLVLRTPGTPQHRGLPLHHSIVCCGLEAHRTASTVSCAFSGSIRSRGTTVSDTGPREGQESVEEDHISVNPAARDTESITANGRGLADLPLMDEQAAGAIAAQLRVIGDEMDEMFRRRRPIPVEQHWDPWWRYLYNVISEALAIFWDPQMDIAQ
ncbi:bcl-2-binding component 3 [Microcaecilia unicolor]|uniref:Uncharacterized protein LOC115480864 n=1 Tax=Microcaecilia unicolor TaxID=1415580 RepID=A0A6P7Z8K0_9AMPH|nr:uncharacterized protein LOC115480864 [Microcaecilia unicolor]